MIQIILSEMNYKRILAYILQIYSCAGVGVWVRIMGDKEERRKSDTGHRSEICERSKEVRLARSDLL
jgi:hypothetical protein